MNKNQCGSSTRFVSLRLEAQNKLAVAAVFTAAYFQDDRNADGERVARQGPRE